MTNDIETIQKIVIRNYEFHISFKIIVYLKVSSFTSFYKQSEHVGLCLSARTYFIYSVTIFFSNNNYGSIVSLRMSTE